MAVSAGLMRMWSYYRILFQFKTLLASTAVNMPQILLNYDAMFYGK
jgi:hypothetical protein